MLLLSFPQTTFTILCCGMITCCLPSLAIWLSESPFCFLRTEYTALGFLCPTSSADPRLRTKYVFFQSISTMDTWDPVSHNTVVGTPPRLHWTRLFHPTNFAVFSCFLDNGIWVSSIAAWFNLSLETSILHVLAVVSFLLRQPIAQWSLVYACLLGTLSGCCELLWFK